MNEIIKETVAKACAEKSVDGFARAIDLYYREVVADWSDEEIEGYEKEYMLSLPDRKSRVYEALEKMLENGLDVNAEYDTMNPLMHAVAWGDYHMVEYLLTHGADPNIWPYMEEEPEEYRKNCYLEGIDIDFMNECWANDYNEEYLNALIETVKVLIRVGGLHSFYGFSLVVNEDGHGEIGPAKLLY